MFSDSPSRCGSEAPLIVRGGSFLVVLQPLECPNLAEIAKEGSPADFGCGIDFEDLQLSLFDECSAITWLVCAPNTGQQVPSLLFPFDSIQRPFRDVALSD